MPKLVVDITESEAERLAWLAKNLDMAGIQTSDSAIVGVLIMTVQRGALENAYKDPGSIADIDASSRACKIPERNRLSRYSPGAFAIFLYSLSLYLRASLSQHSSAWRKQRRSV